MRKKNIRLIVVSSLLLLSIILHTPIGSQLHLQVIKPVKATPAEIIVQPGDSIQEAINNASTWDTILVKAGTYYEHVFVSKTVTLIGENKSTTIIDGGGTGVVIVSNASDVEIRGFTIQNGGVSAESGILLGGRGIGNTIRDNIIRNNANGITLSGTNGCSIINNLIMNCFWTGIQIKKSNNSAIYGNTIFNNTWGVQILTESAFNNTLYHNNFIDNQYQAQSSALTTKWDNGAEGNYWSDYLGVDANGDGIGDTPRPRVDPWDPLDEYPLIEPWSLIRVFDIYQKEEHHYVTLNCSSTVGVAIRGVSFLFSQLERQIRFNVTGPLSMSGFCNVTIPKKLLNATPLDMWLVLFDGINITASVTVVENATHTSLNFTYIHSNVTHRVQVIGIEVIPNLPPIASFEYSPQEPTILDFVNFTDNSTDPDGAIIGRFWDFGDDNNWTDPGLNATCFHKYEKRGTYNVTLTVTDSVQATNTTTKTITVVNAPPTANFTYSPTAPKVYQDVQFTDASTDPEESIDAWLWKFGDGANSTEPDPTHKYSKGGTYEVTLTIKDDENANDTVLRTITVRKVGTKITFIAPPTIAGKTTNVTAVLEDEDENPVSDETIDFYLYENGIWKNFSSTLTNATGFASVPYTPAIAGEYLMRAVYDGSIIYAGNDSTATLVVNLIATTLSVYYVPSTSSVREAIIVTASLKDEEGNPISNETIDFYLYENGEWRTFDFASTNASGLASVTHIPAIWGDHQIMAYYNGSARYFENYITKTIFVNPLVVNLTINAPDPLTRTLGKKITITATLKDENGVPIPNATIEFARAPYLFKDGTWETIGSSKTDSYGVALLEYTPPATGKFYIKAEFLGTPIYGETSVTITLIVNFDFIPYILVGVAAIAAIALIAFAIWRKRKKTPKSRPSQE